MEIKGLPILPVPWLLFRCGGKDHIKRPEVGRACDGFPVGSMDLAVLLHLSYALAPIPGAYPLDFCCATVEMLAVRLASIHFRGKKLIRDPLADGF
jgi:hypothetical protein